MKFHSNYMMKFPCNYIETTYIRVLTCVYLHVQFFSTISFSRKSVSRPLPQRASGEAKAPQAQRLPLRASGEAKSASSHGAEKNHEGAPQGQARGVQGGGLDVVSKSKEGHEGDEGLGVSKSNEDDEEGQGEGES